MVDIDKKIRIGGIEVMNGNMLKGPGRVQQNTICDGILRFRMSKSSKILGGCDILSLQSVVIGADFRYHAQRNKNPIMLHVN